MGTGYTRNDTADNIADGKVIDASDLDGEFDAIEAAFVASTGHTHDGTAAEGGPITVLGPAQEYIGGASDFTPKTTNTYDLGSLSLQWKDLYVDGVAYLDSVDIDAGAIDGTPIGANSASTGAFTNITASGTLSVIGVATIDLSTISSTGDLAVADGGTGAGTAAGARTNLGLVIGTDVQAYDAGLADIAGLAVTDGNFIVGDGVNWVAESGATVRTSLGLGSIATQDSSSVSITGGSISGITDLAVADGGTGASTASGARTNLGLVIGTDVQAYDAGLASIAGLTTAADRMIYTTASDTYAVATLTSAGRAILDDADASAQRTTLGLGSAAVATLIDDDTMATATASNVASAESTKAYVDAAVETYTQTSVIDLTNGGANDQTTVNLATSLSGVSEIIVDFDQLSLTGTNSCVIQLSTSATFATSGYKSGGGFGGTGAAGTSTSGFIINIGVAAAEMSGTMTIRKKPSANDWVASFSAGSAVNSQWSMGGGRVSLGGALDGVRITTNGSDTFDGSSAAWVSYR